MPPPPRWCRSANNTPAVDTNNPAPKHRLAAAEAPTHHTQHRRLCTEGPVPKHGSPLHSPRQSPSSTTPKRCAFRRPPQPSAGLLGTEAPRLPPTATTVASRPTQKSVARTADRFDLRRVGCRNTVLIAGCRCRRGLLDTEAPCFPPVTLTFGSSAAETSFSPLVVATVVSRQNTEVSWRSTGRCSVPRAGAEAPARVRAARRCGLRRGVAETILESGFTALALPVYPVTQAPWDTWRKTSPALPHAVAEAATCSR